MCDRWGHHLKTTNQRWLSPNNVDTFAVSIYQKGAAVTNCWGFVDGSVQPVCHPGTNQRTLYNGHKRVHAIKYQVVSAPNGFCVNLSGPYERKKHDSSMLQESGLLTELSHHSHDANVNTLCIYGDPGHPLRPQLMGPLGGNNLTQDQQLNPNIAIKKHSKYA